MTKQTAPIDAGETYGCSRCGLCLSTCPVYLNRFEETVSPRSKVQLIKQYAEDSLAGSRHLKQIMSLCLMCGACTANCPSGVGHEALFMRMRSKMALDYGENWASRLFYHLLTHEEQMKLAARAVFLGRTTAMDSLLKKKIRIGDIPLNRLPKVNPRPFREQMPEKNAASMSPRGTVLYFTGCATNYLYSGVGRSVVRVLTRLGYRVVIPGGQKCCGLPLYTHGAVKAALANIQKNISLFDQQNIEAVVVDCATCGSALRGGYARVLAESGLGAQAAESLGKKVRDISEFLHDRMDLLTPLLKTPQAGQTVTYHNPCHLRNAQRVVNKVEALLKVIPGIRYAPVHDADACCGGGGSFFYDHPDISGAIAAAKIRNARQTGADFWATGCPGCRMHLAGNIEQNDALSLIHPIELVSRALDFAFDNNSQSD